MRLAIIQARMGSSRLPGKVLMDLNGKPMLKQIYDRLQHCNTVDKVVIATTSELKDTRIVDFAKKYGIEYYTGSELDIVDRMYQTALTFGADIIVRVTADCPLVDPKIIDSLITEVVNDNTLDYVSNVHPATFPDGLDLDVLRVSSLQRLWNATRGDPFNSEWFYNHMKENPDDFKRKNISCDYGDFSQIRLTVDYQDDLDFITEIFKKMNLKDVFYFEDVLNLLNNDDDIKRFHLAFQEKTKFIRDIAFKEALENRENKQKESDEKNVSLVTSDLVDSPQLETNGRDGLYHSCMVSKRVYLRGFEKKDLAGNYFNWANDPEVTYYLFMGTYPNQIELLEERYEKSIRDPNEVQFIVADKATGKVIGFCGIHRIEWIGRSCEYRIFIGEKDFWGKGIGSEAGRLLINYAFEKLNMNKVWLGVNSDHIAGVKSYKRLGFVEEGVLRQEIYRNGKYYDATRMSILRNEFYQNLKPLWDSEE